MMISLLKSHTFMRYIKMMNIFKIKIEYQNSNCSWQWSINESLASDAIKINTQMLPSNWDNSHS